jgi:hypothetical protein
MSNTRRIFTTLYIVITIGATWAAVVSDRVSYPAWPLVGPSEFGAFHHAILTGTRLYLIPPALLSLVMTLAMFWLRSPAISRGLVALVLVCQLIGAFATVGMAIPLQIRMLHGPASAIPEGVRQLISIDLYWRGIPGLLCLIVLAVMIYSISTPPRSLGDL